MARPTDQIQKLVRVEAYDAIKKRKNKIEMGNAVVLPSDESPPVDGTVLDPPPASTITVTLKPI